MAEPASRRGKLCETCTCPNRSLKTLNISPRRKTLNNFVDRLTLQYYCSILFHVVLAAPVLKFTELTPVLSCFIPFKLINTVCSNAARDGL